MRFANLVLIEIAFGFVAMAEATSAYPRITAISGSEMTTHVPEPRGVGDPTQWYKVQTTSAPDDSHLIGLGNFTQRRKGEEGFCKYSFSDIARKIRCPWSASLLIYLCVSLF